ncbi:MAG: hypothetical protein L3J35_09545 [Bacteroidales bacterium]|nr:hypothetical protein [Bacteroidales bacterium]
MKLSELSYETYRYLFDIKYFAKQLKDSDYEEPDIDDIIKDADLLYRIFLKTIEDKAVEEQKQELKKAHILAGKILKQFKNLKCKDDFINEKVDLIVEAFAIKEKTEVFINRI